MTVRTKRKSVRWRAYSIWIRKNPWHSTGIAIGTILVLYTCFLADYSLVQNVINQYEISKLQNQITDCREHRDHDLARLRALDSTSTAIYQFARERYYMKSKSEDVFIFQSADSLKKTMD